MFMLRVLKVQPLPGLRLDLELTDGTHKLVDLTGLLRGPIFEPVRNDPSFFARVTVDPEFGTVTWPNGADLDSDVLILDRRPA
jgi:hypothetical protein